MTTKTDFNSWSSWQDWLKWLIPLLLSIWVFDNKSYLALFFLSGIFYFFLEHDLSVSLFFTLLLSIPFERVLRSWVFEVVVPRPEIWQSGYSFIFGFPLKFIISSTILLLIFSDNKINKDKYLSKNISWLLVGFFIFAMISTLQAVRLELAITGLIRLWLGIWLFFISKHFFSQLNKKTIYKYLISTLLLFGIIGFFQYINQQPLGINMEDISNKFTFGFLTTDGEPIYRISGFMGHPTYFGSFISLLIPVALGFFLKEIKNNKKLTVSMLISGGAFFLGLISIIGTFSRSAWLSLLFIFAAFFMKVKKQISFTKTIKFSKALIYLLIATTIFLFASNSLILIRANSIKYVWSLGTGTGRLELIKHAIAMIKKQPIIGVGLNHFTEAMVYQGVVEKYRGFIYPVHNTFLLFLSETGIPAGLFFIGFLIYLLILSWKKAKKNLVNFGIWIGVVTFLINAQFHTLFNQDPTFDMLMIMCGYLSIL